jgi:hypothetical protein
VFTVLKPHAVTRKERDLEDCEASYGPGRISAFSISSPSTS